MPKLKKSSGKVADMFTQEDYFRMGAEYDALSQQIKELDKRKKDLSSKIKDGAIKFGVIDDKGSSYLENEQFILGNVAKKSLSFDEDKGVEMLESMGLGDIVDVVTTKTINGDKLDKAVREGRISLNDVESFTIEKVTYSVSVKAREEMPEVEQTTVKMAARRRG